MSRSVLLKTSAERDNPLHFIEAQSEVKRGEVALPLGHTTGTEEKLGLKPQTAVGRAWQGHCGWEGGWWDRDAERSQPSPALGAPGRL